MILALRKQGIATRRGIMSVHREKACADSAAGELPETESASDQAIILPLFHGLTAEEQDHVIRSVIQLGPEA